MLTNFKPQSLEETRKALLDNYSKKQPFRVSIGKSKWVTYQAFNPAYNLREILDDEIVFELDCEDPVIVDNWLKALKINLLGDEIDFTIWSHGGKSPHVHIHDLPIGQMDKQLIRTFKKTFMRHYCPEEYHKYLDMSLAGTHLIAIEWQEHWKHKYGVKKLIAEFKKSKKQTEVEEREKEKKLEELREKRMRFEFNAPRVYNCTLEEYFKKILCVTPGALGPTLCRQMELNEGPGDLQ